ncbi:MAG: hypothetical protein RLZZ416_546 [Candidatus Parcubacteria bacterium]|jgi:penicillin-binding protein 2
MSFFRKSRKVREIAPDEIFLDSSNLPEHDAKQFEGRVVMPLSRRAIIAAGAVFACIAVVFAGRAFSLEVVQGSSFADISRANTLQPSIVFASRGVIRDRAGKEIAWNEGTSTDTFALRVYASSPGLSHVLGFVQYPKADKTGQWWREEYVGMSGVEASFDAILRGQNGSRMVETDARGQLQRTNIVVPAKAGNDISLSIDSDLQSKLYSLLYSHAKEQGFQGGAAVIMDVETGEILALTSFPEYDNNAFTSGASSVIQDATNDSHTPLLDRAVSGLYAPGSIVKPIFAAAALNERLIAPETQILSTGQLSVPNPYDPEHPSIFKDWSVHGLINMREAIAVSSDEYFYTIGGGFGGQQGLGIERLDRYARLFGLGSTTGIALRGEQDGVIPTPAWKAQVFGENDPWRIGDTYHTAIGQYGFQLTPLQAARFIAAIANDGNLLNPRLIASSSPEFTKLPLSDADLQVVRDGMRLAVTSKRKDATVKILNIPQIEIAAKTGTAQIGAHNEYMNSWSVGFWPASRPRFAYAVVLEKARAGTPSGAAPAMRPFFEWLIANRPEYVR